MGIGNKLSDLLTLRNKKPGTLASETGINKNTIYAIIKRDSTRVSMSTIEAIANNLGVSVDYFFDNKIEKKAQAQYSELKTTSAANIFPIEKHRIPLLGAIACGEPIFADEDRELYVEVGTSIKADFCLRAQGDSMIGARIHNGDIVFIRKQDMVDDGEIAAVMIGDNATLKRVYYDRTHNILALFAENPAYPTLRYSGEELTSIRILGKAIAFQSDVK